jgi:hypothetical protein
MLGRTRQANLNRPKVRTFLLLSLLVLFIALFFFWRLGSMTPGLGPAEYAARQHSGDLSQIINHGINAPYYLAQYAFTNLLNNSVLALRLASVSFALALTGLIFWLFRSWFGHTIALLASLIFITTPWVLITARTASPDVMYLWPIALIAAFVSMSRSKQKAGMWLVVLGILLAFSLYIPGLVWLILAVIPLAWASLISTTKRVSGLSIFLAIALALLIVAPLVMSLALEPTNIKQLLLIPSDWQSGLQIVKSIGWGLSSFIWQTGTQVDIGLDRLPILSILQIVLMAFGLYALGSRAKNITIGLVGLLFFSVLAAGVNDNPHLLILGLPAVAVLMAAGLRYLFIEWRRVFPLNPFAYGLAISLIALVVGAQLMYAARYSLIAWPQADTTKKTYVLK